jgi:hypothetical protein
MLLYIYGNTFFFFSFIKKKKCLCNAEKSGIICNSVKISLYREVPLTQKSEYTLLLVTHLANCTYSDQEHQALVCIFKLSDTSSKIGKHNFILPCRSLNKAADEQEKLY